MIEWLNSTSQLWWSWISATTLQVSILILLLLALELVTRRKIWPQLRWALWLLILVKLVLPPSLGSPVSLTAPVYEKTSRLFEAYPMSFPAEIDSSQSIRESTVPGVSKAPVPTREKEQAKGLVGNPGATAAPPVRVRRDAVVSKQAEGPTLMTGLMLTWLLVCLVLLGSVAVMIVRLRRRLLRDTRKSRRLTEYALRAASRLGLDAIPEVVLSSRIETPAVFGVIRPLILIPRNRFEKLSSLDLENTLIHELAHVRRRDLLIQRIGLLLHVVFWFNPFLWLVRTRIRHLSEICCDLKVRNLLGNASDSYRGTILRAAESYLSTRRRQRSEIFCLMERSSRLGERLSWLEWNFRKHRRLRFVVMLMVVLCGATLAIPMTRSSQWGATSADAFTLILKKTLTPVGPDKPYIEEILVWAKKSYGESQRFSVRSNPLPGEEVILSWRGAFEPSPSLCRSLVEEEGAANRKEAILGYEAYPLTIRSDDRVHEEVFYAPALGCIPIKKIRVERGSVAETVAIDLIRGRGPLHGFDPTLPPMSPLEQNSFSRNPWSREPERARFLKELWDEHSQNISEVEEYQEMLRTTVDSLTGLEGEEAYVTPVDFFNYWGHGHVEFGPEGALYFAPARSSAIYRSNENGDILETYVTGPESKFSRPRFFTVDRERIVHALVGDAHGQEDIPPRSQVPWKIRKFQSAEVYGDTAVELLEGRSLAPLDFDIDELGRYHILNWQRQPSPSFELVTLDSNGFQDQGILLKIDPALMAAGNWPVNPSYGMCLEILRDGRAFLLVRHPEELEHVQIMDGRLFEVELSTGRLNPLRLEPPSRWSRLTRIFESDGRLVLVWSDYEEQIQRIADASQFRELIDQKQPKLMLGTYTSMTRLTLIDSGDRLPITAVRGTVDAVSDQGALLVVGPPNPGPSLFLVE